jgi:hypothetical protein
VQIEESVEGVVLMLKEYLEVVGLMFKDSGMIIVGSV